MLLYIYICAFPIPLIVAFFLGWRGGRTNPQTAMEFARAAAFYVAWAIMVIFLWHTFWIATVVPAHWQDTMRSAVSWTLGTGAIWFPVMMITFVLRAMKARRED